MEPTSRLRFDRVWVESFAKGKDCKGRGRSSVQKVLTRDSTGSQACSQLAAHPHSGLISTSYLSYSVPRFLQISPSNPIISAILKLWSPKWTLKWISREI